MSNWYRIEVFSHIVCVHVDGVVDRAPTGYENLKGMMYSELVLWVTTRGGVIEPMFEEEFDESEIELLVLK